MRIFSHSSRLEQQRKDAEHRQIQKREGLHFGIHPNCPRCSLNMTKRHVGQMGQYICLGCYGIVASVSVLERFLSGPERIDFMQRARAAEVGKAPCSHCRQRMRIVWHRKGEQNLELDYCSSCSLLWFDSGEWKSFEESSGRAEKPLSGPAVHDYAKALLQMDRDSHQNRDAYKFESKSAESPVKVALGLGLIGLPVEEENDVFYEKPWVTWGLILACFAAYFATVKTGSGVIEAFGYYARGSIPSQLGHAITSFFLHGGVWHLLGNMYFLWIFGDNVEDEIGKSNYLGFLALATISGAFLAAKSDPRMIDVPLVGASGGIAGLVAFYLLRFPRRRFIVRIAYVFSTAVPSLFFGIFFFSKDLIGIAKQLAGATNVSHLAHIGGAAVGVFASIVFGKKTPR